MDQSKFEQKARELHVAIFPEEYDYQYDSIADWSDRSRGISPMSSDYIERVNARRQEFGFGPVDPVGITHDIDTYAWVEKMVRETRFEELDKYITRTAADSAGV